MFDIVRNNRILVQVILGLITLTFAFFGIQSYIRSSGGGADVARVGDARITLQEFDRALREQQDRMRAQMNGQPIPQAMLDTPQIRSAVMENLVNRQLLGTYAKKAGLTLTDEQLAQFIASVPSLQEDGHFSPNMYAAFVQAQGMSKEAFEANLRHDMVMQQLAGAIAGAAFTSKTAADNWIAAQLEEREVAAAVLKPEDYLARIKLAPDAAQAYYTAQRKNFEVPAQVRAEFVVFSPRDLVDQVSVSEADINAAYAAHKDRYQQGEERRASHILISADKNAAASVIAAAQAKATALLAQLRKNPNAFAALARQNSQDPGSAAKGGDLDWFGHGAMVKPVEDAVFALKEGQISDVVRSDFGFHIIKLTGIRGGHDIPLATARGEIENGLKLQAAAKKYAEVAETFTNTVYEQGDSLKPVADKFKLVIQQSGWITKGVAGNGLASNPKLLQALFSDDAIKEKHNTEAIEVAPNTMVSARVVEFKPAALQPFEAVKGGIEKQLALEQARKLAAQDGADKLARLKKGESLGLQWGASRRVARAGAENFSRAAAQATFKVDAAALPGYAGADGADGAYTLYRVTAVFPYRGGDDPRAKTLHDQYAQLMAAVEFSAWLDTLRASTDIDINKTLLEKKEQ